VKAVVHGNYGLDGDRPPEYMKLPGIAEGDHAVIKRVQVSNYIHHDLSIPTEPPARPPLFTIALESHPDDGYGYPSSGATKCMAQFEPIAAWMSKQVDPAVLAVDLTHSFLFASQKDMTIYDDVFIDGVMYVYASADYTYSLSGTVYGWSLVIDYDSTKLSDVEKVFLALREMGL